MGSRNLRNVFFRFVKAGEVIRESVSNPPAYLKMCGFPMQVYAALCFRMTIDSVRSTNSIYCYTSNEFINLQILF